MNLRAQWYDQCNRPKPYHIPFWIAYQLIMTMIYSQGRVFSWVGLEIIFMYIVIEATGAYFNIYFLMPRLLKKKRYVWYILGLALDMVATAVLIALGFYLIFSGLKGYFISLEELITFFGTRQNLFNATFYSASFAIVLVLVLKMGKAWFSEQARSKRLEKEKLETELKFLKSQFNPHFLFNVINSIFFLIQTDQKRASDTLAKFSEILRYQLYECNEPAIPLAREARYLSDFIALERLRAGDSLDVQWEIQEDMNGAEIAPFLLIPFVENAFKHVSKGKSQANFIKVNLKQINGQIIFDVCNSKEPKSNGTEELVKYGGIGLENVQRRLKLLYPQQHKLQIEDENHVFTVHLTLSSHAD